MISNVRLSYGAGRRKHRKTIIIHWEPGNIIQPVKYILVQNRPLCQPENPEVSVLPWDWAVLSIKCCKNQEISALIM